VKEIDETDGEFLLKLANEAGYLVTVSPDGDVILARANIGDKPVAALIEGKLPLLSLQANFDGSKRFSQYVAYPSDSGLEQRKKIAWATVQDEKIPGFRRKTFRAEYADGVNLDETVGWMASRAVAESVDIKAVVAGWRNPEGEIWAPNSTVTLSAPGEYLLKEAPYLVSSVTLTKDESGGDIAELSLVLPEAYTLGLPSSYPWDTK
jgi:prophage tail gpP-like protein